MPPGVGLFTGRLFNRRDGESIDEVRGREEVEKGGGGLETCPLGAKVEE